jgi:transmembrane sensor
MSLDASHAPFADGPGGGRLTGIPPRVARRAVEWLVALQSEAATDPTRRAWQRWREEHPDHERAWRHIEAVNGRLQELASPLGSAVAHAALAPPRSPKRREAVRTLAVLLFAGGGVAGVAWLADEDAPWRERLADERTGVGERRTVRLADGTTVALNTASAIDLRFSAGERRIRLVGGEILVTTGPDGDGLAPRPFVVETAQGELRPLGTRFAVRRQSDATRVDVFEGAVEVRPRHGGGRTLRLNAGEQVRFTDGRIADPGPADEAATAWTDGMIVASGLRLADFLAELARHRPGRLSYDPAVAGLRVSGTYPLADTERILDALGTTLPVEVRFFTRYWVTVRPAARNPPGA